MSRFRIYKASAGSGKTFSLVYEYIRILIDNPNEYKHILAVTFTNDATEEMKERVLMQLKKLASEPERSSYIDLLVKDTGREPFHIGKRAAEALSNILHDYSNFYISTIDTFFQKILRSFAKDIGLAAAYNLQLDPELAVQEVTESVIAKTDHESRQARWLMKAAVEKIEDGKNWNIRNELKELFKETFKENYQIKEEKIQNSFRDEESIAQFQLKLKEDIVEFESSLKQMASKCNGILVSYGLTVSDFPYKESSFYSWVLKLSAGEIKEPGVRFLGAIDNLDSWFSKSTPEVYKEKISAAYSDCLNDTIKELHIFYQSNIETYNSNIMVRENLAYFVMLDSMVQEMMKYKAENDVLFISDTNQFIREVVGNNDESFIFEKSGNYFHHYLIDEFQDTSQLQWENFKPLISNAVSQDNVSLVVGDVKQSIYRFRNGDWRLLHEKAAADITYNEEIILKDNHRSRENIVKFNNTLYRVVPLITSYVYKQDLNGNSEWEQMFLDCYSNQEQNVPQRNIGSGGYVEICLIEKGEAGEEEEESSIKEQKLNKLVKDIANVLERGYQPSDIAVLVYRKAEAYQTAAHLRNYVEENNLHDKINIVTQSSLNIFNAHSVRIVVAALYYLTNKHDEVNLANVYYEYLRYVNGKEPDFMGYENDPKMQAFIADSKIIKSYPLQLLTDHIIHFFDLGSVANEEIFIQHFKDAVLEYLRSNPDDISGFMEWWEEHYSDFQVEVPQNSKSLQIITIHSSKGLEFEIVFMPFAEWSFDNTGFTADLLWLDVKHEKDLTLPVKYNALMKQSKFYDDFARTKFYNYLDKLNLLYVATTRAVSELYIYTKKPSGFDPNKLQTNIGTLFNYLFNASFELDGDLYTSLEEGINSDRDQLIIGVKTVPIKKEKEIPVTGFSINVPIKDIFQSVSVKQQAVDLRDDEYILHEELKQTGILFHQVMQTRSKEEAISFISRLRMQRMITTEMRDGFIKSVNRFYDQPLIQKWTSGYTSYAEYSFGTENRIIKPDKLFVGETDCIVLDFKTGKPMPEHADQVGEYCKTVELLFNKPVTGYIYYTQADQLEKIYP